MGSVVLISVVVVDLNSILASHRSDALHGGLRQNLSGSDLRPVEQPAAFGSRGSAQPPLGAGLWPLIEAIPQSPDLWAGILSSCDSSMNMNGR